MEADLLSGSPEELGRIDTFSREDSRLLEAAVAALDHLADNERNSWPWRGAWTCA